ncbi:MAG: hypothetical protein ABI367_09095 [Mucilaginibacter sp.]
MMFEFLLNEKAVLSSPAIGDKHCTNFKSSVQQNVRAEGYHDQNEFTEIDLFTGRIRIICRK